MRTLNAGAAQGEGIAERARDTASLDSPMVPSRCQSELALLCRLGVHRRMKRSAFFAQLTECSCP